MLSQKLSGYYEVNPPRRFWGKYFENVRNNIFQTFTNTFSNYNVQYFADCMHNCFKIEYIEHPTDAT
jgi:hypothetical protein